MQKGLQSHAHVAWPGVVTCFPASHFVQSDMEVARDVRKCSDYKWASAPQQPAVSFLPNCREGEPHMAEPGCEPSSEESLGTEEPTAADPESPQQKQPRCHEGEGEVDSPLSREPAMGLDTSTLGSRPEPKAVA